MDYMDVEFWLIYLVYPIIGAVIGLVVGSLLLIFTKGKSYGWTFKESLRAALLNK